MMGPHDLLCKWCSTFVGKGKKFCSIFCESRYTRSKRRKLAFRRPAYSGGTHHDKDYESPRSNKTAPARKETFLEDVITAMDSDKPAPERDKRPDEASSERSSEKPTPAASDQLEHSATGQSRDTTRDTKETSSVVVPKLDLSSPKSAKDAEKRKLSARQRRGDKRSTDHDADESKQTKDKPKEAPKKSARGAKKLDNVRSKTQTLLVHDGDSKIPVRNRTVADGKEVDLNKTAPLPGANDLEDSVKAELKIKRLSSLNDKKKLELAGESDIYHEAVQRHKSKTALELEKKVRSSGYGNPVNPKLRPMALKPRSATVSGSVTKYSRNASAKSDKSSTMDVSTLSNEDSRPINSGRNSSKWELIPTTIKEEGKNVNVNGNMSLEDEDPTPRSSQRKVTKNGESKRGLGKIDEIVREVSTHSELPSRTELQIRLSSIKRKVEVKKRGRDSRSSYGSDLDSSFQDSTTDLTTDRDLLNTSFGTNKSSKTSRASARSNITRISKQFQSHKVE